MEGTLLPFAVITSQWPVGAHTLGQDQRQTHSTHRREDQALEMGSLFRKTTFHRALSWWSPNPSHRVVRLLSPHTNTPVSRIQQVSGCLQNV